MEDFTVIDVDRGDHYPTLPPGICPHCHDHHHRLCRAPCGCAHPHHWQPDHDPLPARQEPTP